MYEWDAERRRAAAIDAQHHVNEEIAARSKTVEPGDNGKLLLVLVAVIFFKPLAEYCIELYNTLTGYAHCLAVLLGS